MGNNCGHQIRSKGKTGNKHERKQMPARMMQMQKSMEKTGRPTMREGYTLNQEGGTQEREAWQQTENTETSLRSVG